MRKLLYLVASYKCYNPPVFYRAYTRARDYFVIVEGNVMMSNESKFFGYKYHTQ